MALERTQARTQQVTQAVVLALPFLLIHARAAAEGVFGVLAILMLIRTALHRDPAPYRQPWVLLAFAYWAWLVAVSLGQGVAWPMLLQALAWGRIPLAILALSSWLLADARIRRWLLYSTGLASAWIMLECWLQVAFGRGLMGQQRFDAGQLMGPFPKPRAGTMLLRLMLPALTWVSSVGGLWVAIALPSLALVTLALIGQRMPFVQALALLPLLALLMPKLRLPAALALAAGAAGVLLAPGVSERMSSQFLEQLSGFPESHYGQIFARALAMGQQHPWTGLGFDAFRTHCEDPRYFQGWALGSDDGGAAICVPHPHNHYLEALTNTGFPGLVLFSALAIAWLVPLARGLVRRPDPVRLGLLAAALVTLFPVAGTTAFTVMPTGGAFFLLLGWGLAAAQADAKEQRAACTTA